MYFVRPFLFWFARARALVSTYGWAACASTCPGPPNDDSRHSPGKIPKTRTGIIIYIFFLTFGRHQYRRRGRIRGEIAPPDTKHEVRRSKKKKKNRTVNVFSGLSLIRACVVVIIPLKKPCKMDDNTRTHATRSTVGWAMEEKIVRIADRSDICEPCHRRRRRRCRRLRRRWWWWWW